jgi:hypothetical protein
MPTGIPKFGGNERSINNRGFLEAALRIVRTGVST